LKLLFEKSPGEMTWKEWCYWDWAKNKKDYRLVVDHLAETFCIYRESTCEHDMVDLGSHGFERSFCKKCDYITKPI